MAAPHTTLATLASAQRPAQLAPTSTLLAALEPGPPALALREPSLAPLRYHTLGSTARGIMIGVFSVLAVAAAAIIVAALVYFFRHTAQGRIFLDRLARPGEYDDEQAFAKDEAEALAEMDDLHRTEYLRAKGMCLSPGARAPSPPLTVATAFVQANPPESVHTDISLSQFLAIQEKGVSAWEFEPELEIANCFVEGRTEIEFFDAECSVQSNLPMPKQNEVYYWEAKIYDKPDTSTIAIGVTTKPYPLFRLPGFHKWSVAYTSHGSRRCNQPFTPTPYGPAFVQGDVVGIGYRPRTGTLFFTRNGKKLDDVAHGLKAHNFFPTVGANGPCQVHVNFGQLGFVFIEANVKKWGLAPMTGSLAPPPPYGSEQGSILLEGGRDGVREGMAGPHHHRSASQQLRGGRVALPPPPSPGPQRSPTDISLAQLRLAAADDDGDDAAASEPARRLGLAPYADAPPDYESPLRVHAPDAPIPSYDAAVAQQPSAQSRMRGDTIGSRVERRARC